ncbi:MAG: hypothetical protein JWL81_1761 [Verrucomicrobiales bacterium]|nr:hypothetical protein [Verrucomicrobiales bacterium]
MKPKPFNAARGPEYVDLLRQSRRRVQNRAIRAEARELSVEGTAPRSSGGNRFLLGVVGLGLVVTLAGLVWILPAWRTSRQDASAGVGGQAASRVALLSPADCADGFLKATSQEERLRFIRLPELAGPVMQQFYESGPGAVETVEEHKPILSGQLDPPVMGRSYSVSGRFQVALRDGGQRYLYTVEENGETKVDFHVYARHTDPPWPEITSGRAVESKVRVSLSPGDYYQAPFADSDEWLALRATHPDLPADLTLYLRRSDTSLTQLTNLPPDKSLRFFLKIAPIGNSWSQRQYEIKAILSPDWLEPTPAP